MREGAHTLFVLLLCLPLHAFSQEGQSLLDITSEQLLSGLPRNSASVLFDRNVNTINWVGRALVDTSFWGLRFRLAEQYTSNIIMVEGGQADQRPESNQQRLSMRAGVPVTDNLSALTTWSSLVYSDNKAVGLSTASVNTLLAGIEYNPLDSLAINPMIGYRWDNQLGLRDRGMSYGVGARLSHLDLDGYGVTASGQAHRERLDPRVLERHFARAQVLKQFTGKTRDSLVVGFYQNRKEFYAALGNTIESRTENVFSTTNLLEYEFAPELTTSVFVNITSRNWEKDQRHYLSSPTPTLRFDTGIEEFRLDTYIQSVYESDERGVSAMARLSFSERDEKHFAKPLAGDQADSVRFLFAERNKQEQTKDNLSRRTSLAGAVAFPVSTSDRVSIAGTASILRYDTQSQLNVEDRDELLIALSLGTHHYLNRYLELSLELSGNLSHTVYLLRDRSANNNYNRVLRFSPRTVFRPSSDVTSVNAFEVLANYTVYDFEQQILQARSFSYRQFGWMDSTEIQLSPTVGIDFFLYWKVYERGQLNWHEFTERLENSFFDRTYALQVRTTPFAGARFALGLRYFSQSRFGYAEGNKTLDSFLRSFGPTCLIEIGLSEHSLISLQGWYEQRKMQNGARQAYANLTMNVHIIM